MGKYNDLMFPTNDYHMFNQGINHETIFKTKADKNRFVKYLKFYLKDIADIYTKSVMPNHFHCVIKLKSKYKILKLIKKDKKIKNFVKKFKGKSKAYIASRIVSEKLRGFFISYAQYFNRKHKRDGNVFRKNFQRTLISNTIYLKNCIVYVNRNITNHFPNIDYKDYKWSDFSCFLDKTYIDSLAAFFDFYELFESIDNFINLHEKGHREDKDKEEKKKIEYILE
ncbi:MAG: transposase [Bacteroidales bacterium]|jgi:putative transposase